MKKILISICAAALAFCSCQNLDEVNSRISELQGRVTSLEALCSEMNGNVQAVQQFVKAREGNLYVTNVKTATNGFTITFDDGQSYTIVNGEKGNKGDKGDQGPEGNVGPMPSVTIETSDGGYYWKVNNEWALIDGKKVSALGVTPQLKIDGGNWNISYDGGTSWTTVAPAYDEASKITVTEDADNVYLALAAGNTITLPKVPGFKFCVSQLDELVLGDGAVKEIPYTISKGDETVRFAVVGNGYSAEVVPADNNGGVIKVTAPTPAVNGYLSITAIQNSTGESKSQYLSFEQGVLSIQSDAALVEVLGGQIDIAVTTNNDYTVVIPDDAKEWVRVVETKALRTETVTLAVAENTSDDQRVAVVEIVPAAGTKSLFTITQKTGAVVPEFGVEQLELSADKDATSATFNITGNVPWTISLSEGLGASSLSGNGAAEITLTFPHNLAEGKKKYTATVSSTVEKLEVKEYTVVLTQTGLPRTDDYYAQFLAGENLVINGVNYNISQYPSPRVLTPDQLADGIELVKNVTEAGILFIDDEESATVNVVCKTIYLPDVVIVGRYARNQPTLYIANLNVGICGDVTLKNVCIKSDNTYSIFDNSPAPTSKNIAFTLEDCTILGQGEFLRDFSASYCIKDYAVNNCIIVTPKPILVNYKNKTVNSPINSYRFYNNVITTPTGAVLHYKPLNTTVDININTFEFSHNTLYNVKQNPTIQIQRCNKFNMDYNLFAADLNTAACIVSLIEALPANSGSTLTGNKGYSTTATGWTDCYSGTTNNGVVKSGSSLVKSAASLPFLTVDPANGYLPIDTSVITDNSGASYATKLWIH